MSNESLNTTVKVLNQQGLHARPADLLVRTASQFASQIQIGKNGEWVDARSILSLLTLGAAQGTDLVVEVKGSDSSEALKAIEALFAQGFNENDETVEANTSFDA